MTIENILFGMVFDFISTLLIKRKKNESVTIFILGFGHDDSFSSNCTDRLQQQWLKLRKD